MMMPEQFTCHDLDLTAQTNYPSDTTDAGFHVLSTMSKEQLVSSKIAGGRRINLLDNMEWIDSRKDKHWMGFNECCAYLHSTIASTEKNKFCIEFIYDDHYCKYFEKESSFWTLEFSDAYRETLGKGVYVCLDGKKTKSALDHKQVLELPAGLGRHRIEIVSKE